MTIETARLRDVIVTAIATAAEIDPETIDDDVNLFDLGLDSLNFAGILVDIEDGIGAEIPVEVLDRFLNVGDVVTMKDVIAHLSVWDPATSPAPYGDVVVPRP
jgi:acyl carrier protein